MVAILPLCVPEACRAATSSTAMSSRSVAFRFRDARGGTAPHLRGDRPAPCRSRLLVVTLHCQQLGVVGWQFRASGCISRRGVPLLPPFALHAMRDDRWTAACHPLATPFYSSAVSRPFFFILLSCLLPIAARVCCFRMLLTVVVIVSACKVGLQLRGQGQPRARSEEADGCRLGTL